MSDFKKNVLHKLFIVFLFIYAFYIGSHLLEINWTLYTGLLFLLGIIVAGLAHAKRNYITIGILLGHMSIEWLSWSGSSLSFREIMLNGVHVIMDLLFLSHELSAHAKSYTTTVIGILSLLVISIITLHNHIVLSVQATALLAPFIIGGVLGCIVAHVYYHIKKE